MSETGRAARTTPERPARDRILDAAESRARTCGYNGFSFRDLAQDVGVKSASVHYHFPTKGDLGVELARRYAERARETLGAPEAASPAEARARVAGLFQHALRVDGRMCLCGLLGAERDGLPEAVNDEVRRFFEMLLGYLRAADAQAGGAETAPAGRPSPEASVALLEGGLILARALDDPSVFDRAIAGLFGADGSQNR